MGKVTPNIQLTVLLISAVCGYDQPETFHYGLEVGGSERYLLSEHCSVMMPNYHVFCEEQYLGKLNDQDFEIEYYRGEIAKLAVTAVDALRIPPFLEFKEFLESQLEALRPSDESPLKRQRTDGEAETEEQAEEAVLFQPETARYFQTGREDVWVDVAYKGGAALSALQVTTASCPFNGQVYEATFSNTLLIPYFDFKSLDEGVDKLAVDLLCATLMNTLSGYSTAKEEGRDDDIVAFGFKNCFKLKLAVTINLKEEQIVGDVTMSRNQEQLFSYSPEDKYDAECALDSTMVEKFHSLMEDSYGKFSFKSELAENFFYKHLEHFNFFAIANTNDDFVERLAEREAEAREQERDSMEEEEVTAA